MFQNQILDFKPTVCHEAFVRRHTFQQIHNTASYKKLAVTDSASEQLANENKCTIGSDRHKTFRCCVGLVR